ncbi:hypothetical protein Q4603_04020 [Zobellia galactanivorans]|uniref:Conserved hypothetical membrane protein n=1 Tax=Zobellia galactanivorans (strain DSM 12802 / CCUG 47099 / CIP 106680 / NCIMB 13871 / Dsij) TaxID=63186 RepID=G0L7P5_ZOBGA|nr:MULTISPECIES: hypothetical protein [Zobellia]MDO6807755.1 hypothetical protein [Zobellia galactanivorans]OWW25560.1 hypothetical protein B4Q04_08085 [Zobellia sp. OII3]CAZ98178.1 Conserved hypothetical membrane protein [Zobellia galactanivorans]
MKNNIPYVILLFVLLFTSPELVAQYGYGGGGYGYGGGGYGYGRQRSAIPQVQETPKAPEPKTAEQIVNDEMPGIAQALELNEFESAVMSSVLKKYLQKRIEMQILELSPEQMREGMEKITKAQDEELKAGLPIEKYEAFVEMQKKGLQKTQKEKKREKKRKKKKSKD